MNRAIALTLLNIASIQDKPSTSWDEFDRAVRRMIIEFAHEALTHLRAEDIVNDYRGAHALIAARHRCFDCFVDKRTEPHNPTCEIDP